MAALTEGKALQICDERAAAKAALMLQGETVFMSSLCMVTAGKVRRVTTGVANSKLLGAAARDYGTATGADLAVPMVFKRGVIGLYLLSGAEPTAANLMSPVRLVDDCTISNAVIGANDLSVKLLFIEDSLGWCEVL